MSPPPLRGTTDRVTTSVHYPLYLHSILSTQTTKNLYSRSFYLKRVVLERYPLKLLLLGFQVNLKQKVTSSF